MAGKLTLTESNNETRILWKINHFFTREDNLIVSPDFILFKSKWFLQLHLGSKLIIPDTEHDSCEPLRMSLLSLNPTTKYHIECRMGIQVCTGSEITTEKFESVINKVFCQTPQRHKLISRNAFKRSINTLVTQNTLAVFCTVRLISAVNPDKDVLSSIPSTDGDFSSSLPLFCDESQMFGEITLDESKNETRIEWKVTNICNIVNYFIKSPYFVFSNLKWFLQLPGVPSTFIKSLSEPDNRVFDSFLSMNLETSYNRKAGIHMEYRMGIQMSNGSEISTEKFEYILASGISCFPTHKIISRKDCESASDILDSENTLKVFCTVRLLSDCIGSGYINLLGNFSCDYYIWYNETVGEITSDNSKHETRVDWTINHFFAMQSNRMKSPDFILSKINWFLVIFSVDRNNNASKKSLCMCLQRDFNSTAEHHIEYRMGIQRSDGSEVITEKFESVFQPRFEKSLRRIELISGKDFKSLRHTLSHGSTLKVFCTVRLLNEVNPSENVQSANASTQDTGASYENPKCSSLTKGSFSLHENANDVPLVKNNSAIDKKYKVSGLTKESFNFEIFKGTAASFENFKNSSLTNDIFTFNAKHVHLTKGNSTLNTNNEVSWPTKGIFKFDDTFKGIKTSSENSKDVCLSKGIHTLIENLENSYRSKRFTDVTIKVKDKEFLAHKTILSIRSEVFASMFEHDTSEKRSNIVDITDCDPHSFENFLLYLYTGKLDTVSSNNATSLFKTADKYGVEELKSECVRCMAQEITVHSFCDIFHLSILHSESDLLATATDFFIRNASAILITKEWITLLEEHTLLCNELLVKFAKSNSGLSKANV